MARLLSLFKEVAFGLEQDVLLICFCFSSPFPPRAFPGLKSLGKPKILDDDSRMGLRPLLRRKWV